MVLPAVDYGIIGLQHGQPYSDYDWPFNNVWEKVVVEGSWLVCIMNAPEEAVAPSRWSKYNDLQSYGWNVREVISELHDQSMGNVWKSLGVSPYQAKWTFISATHENDTTHSEPNGVKTAYPASFGWYDNIFVVEDGVICAESNFGPEHVNEAMESNISQGQITPLKHWSDVIWLIWEELNKESRTNIRNLQHIFCFDVTNFWTKERILEIMHRYGHFELQPPAWPGLRLGMTNELALALMNTSKVAGIARLLGQHKQKLGVRIVDEVRIFSTVRDRTTGATYWNLYFHVTGGPLSREQFLAERYIDASDWAERISDSENSD